jgi:hypothetical protein
LLFNGNEQPPIDRLAQKLEHEMSSKETIQEEEEIEEEKQKKNFKTHLQMKQQQKKVSH